MATKDPNSGTSPAPQPTRERTLSDDFIPRPGANQDIGKRNTSDDPTVQATQKTPVDPPPTGTKT